MRLLFNPFTGRFDPIPMRFGSTTSYSQFEADGTYKANGLATVYNDINISVSTGKVPAANFPAWATVVGPLSAYRFAVNDHIDLATAELLHDWKEGSDIEVHVHWLTGGNNDATARGVRWQIDYAIANTPLQGSGSIIMTAGTLTMSADTVIAANEVANTTKYSSLGTIALANYGIGSMFMMHLTRVAASGTAPAAGPFALQAGIHYEIDTLGSRSILTK